MAYKVPQVSCSRPDLQEALGQALADLKENQDRHCDALIFFLLEEEKEVRGHMCHPRSCIRVAAGPARPVYLPPPNTPGLPPPIGSRNENHAVRFRVLWKTVNAGLVFTL